ncbi:hypothetical protein HMPREF1246_0549 [Acidaminococcus sp. BV3L6]|nr:hypothetical protein HMPREF1246_0549 [Acidaminococcus sp. BV3L6]
MFEGELSSDPFPRRGRFGSGRHPLLAPDKKDGKKAPMRYLS